MLPIRASVYFCFQRAVVLNKYQHTTQCVSVCVCMDIHSGNLISGKLIKITLKTALAHPGIEKMII